MEKKQNCKSLKDKLKRLAKQLGKETSGITVIALVVTVVILVILSSVTLRILIKNGIVRGTEQQREMYENKAVTEQKKLDRLMNEYKEATSVEEKKLEGQVTIKIKDSKGMSIEFNAMIHIYNTNRELIKDVTINGTEVKTTLPYGNYYLTTETAPSGYYGRTDEINFDVYNANTVVDMVFNSVTRLSVKVEWVDEGDTGKRPNVQVQLFKDGKEYNQPISLSEENGWSYTWTNLDDSYTWTVKEVGKPEGYRSEITNNGNDYTIKYVKTIDIPITIKWLDADGQELEEGPAGSQITIRFYRDEDKYGEPIMFDENNNWTYTIKDLDVYADDGERAFRYWVECSDLQDYDYSIEGDQEKGFTINFRLHAPPPPPTGI